MNILLALFDDGTHGTRSEPSRVIAKAPRKWDADQRPAQYGTCGTLGTPPIYQADLAQRVNEIADAWRERLAIVLETGDIGEPEAYPIAEAEIGAEFVRAFLPAEVAA